MRLFLSILFSRRFFVPKSASVGCYYNRDRKKNGEDLRSSLVLVLVLGRSGRSRQKEGERGERGQDEDANCFSRTKLDCIALLDGASRFFGDSERVARKRFDEFSAKSTSNRINSRGNIRTLKKNGLVPNNFLGRKINWDKKWLANVVISRMFCI